MPVKEHILVAGGAGYIGSHTVQLLLDQGYQVTVIDNLSTGHARSVAKAALIHCDLCDKGALSQRLENKTFTGIIHFAGKSQVSESMVEPLTYFENNVTGSLNLISYAVKAGIDRLVFSSSAAVYGHPNSSMIDESHVVKPINPYGTTKVMVETVLAESARAQGLNSIALRYFNAAGAWPDQGLGEDHDPETHLIPAVLKSLLTQDSSGLNQEPVKLFGNDYATVDGTCIRDYVHVRDLAEAHVLALRHLKEKTGAQIVNLGSGNGYSVLDIIQTCQQVTGKEVPYVMAPRRLGDPAVLVANNQLARETLDWQPHRPLVTMIEDAWQWHQRQ